MKDRITSVDWQNACFHQTEPEFIAATPTADDPHVFEGYYAEVCRVCGAIVKKIEPDNENE
jgi:hypothetical protein